MHDILEAIGVVALCLAVPVAYLALRTRFGRRSRLRGSALYDEAFRVDDVGALHLPAKLMVETWTDRLRQVGFRRLGDVQTAGDPDIARVLVDDTGNVTAWATEWTGVLLLTTFEDGYATTSTIPIQNRIEDLLLPAIDAHRAVVGARRAEHGNPIVVDRIDQWLSIFAAFRSRFAPGIRESHDAAVRRLRVRLALLTGALAVGGAALLLLSGRT